MSQDASSLRHDVLPSRTAGNSPGSKVQPPSAAPTTAQEASREVAAMPSERRGIDNSWLVVSLGVLVVFLILWAVPLWQVSNLNLAPRDQLLTVNTLRDTWAKILATLFLLIGAYYTWRYVEALGRTVVAAERTTAAAEQSAFISSERHITERFVRVMELLGDEKLEVRLGGIYALERIARDSPNDQNAVTEVLAAYIREHAPWSSDQPPPNRVRSDIQAILTVLGRRAWAGGEEETLDLHETALATAYLPFARFQGAYLYEANLRGAMLYNANLRGAWLWKAHLHNAILEGAHLEGADLTAAEGVTWEQLQQAHIDKTTKLPDALRASMPDYPYERQAAPRTAPPEADTEEETREEDDGRSEFAADAQVLPTKLG